MNQKENKTDERLVEYQTNKLHELISEVHGCCKERVFLEAKMFGLPPAVLKCLMIFDGQRYITGMEVAGKLEVAKSRATVIIDGLERKGMIQRVADPNDARVKLISLTQAGHNKVREIEDFVFHLHHQLLEHIEPSQRANVIAALEVLRSSMKEVKARMSSG